MCIICAIYSVDNKLKDEPKPKKTTTTTKKSHSVEISILSPFRPVALYELAGL